MSVFAVTYTYLKTGAELRAEHLGDHRTWVGHLRSQSILYDAGPLTDKDASLLLIEAPSSGDAIAIMNEDPFYELGLIEHRDFSEWTPRWGVVAAASQDHKEVAR